MMAQRAKSMFKMEAISYAHDIAAAGSHGQQPNPAFRRLECSLFVLMAMRGEFRTVLMVKAAPTDPYRGPSPLA